MQKTLKQPALLFWDSCELQKPHRRTPVINRTSRTTGATNRNDNYAGGLCIAVKRRVLNHFIMHACRTPTAVLRDLSSPRIYTRSFFFDSILIRIGECFRREHVRTEFFVAIPYKVLQIASIRVDWSLLILLLFAGNSKCW